MVRLQSLLVLACAVCASSVSLRGKPMANRGAGSAWMLREVLEEEACLQAIDEKRNSPVMLYLTKRGPKFHQTGSSRFLEELLEDVKVRELILCETADPVHFTPLVLKKAPTSRVGLIFNCMFVSWDSLYEIVARSPRKPDMLMHLGDAGGNMEVYDWYQRILPKDGLVIRQYSHGYTYPAQPKVRHMPVGYDKNLDFGGESCEAASRAREALNATSRKYLWSFMGGKQAGWQSERHMLEELMPPVREGDLNETLQFRKKLVALGKDVSGKFEDRSETIAELDRSFAKAKFFLDMSNQMREPAAYEVLKDSTFAPTGAFEIENLETPALYHAVLAGAIPVIVGTPAQVKPVFKYHHDPPFIFAETWEEAKRKMLSFGRVGGGGNIVQDRLRKWWCDWTDALRFEIASFLVQ